MKNSNNLLGALHPRILYIGLQYDYGNPKLGHSFEYINFYETLIRSEWCRVDLFPFDEIMRKDGRDEMNAQLLRTVDKLHPDFCFFVLFTDEIKKETIKAITEKSGSITFNWFTDDHWRFNNYSRYWAPLFHWVSTTDSEAVELYKQIGYENIIKTQWGFNHHIYKNYDVPQNYDVTFIGQVHSDRKRIVQRLKKNGINIECWGKGWLNGRLNQDEMVKMFSQSKINLNFTHSSYTLKWKPIAKIFLNRRADDSFHMNSVMVITRNMMALTKKRRSQIKARTFEIPGSGGFLLSQDAGNLEEYFVPEKEIAVFTDTDDLLDKIKYYLEHDEKREAIRQAGYQRAIRDHSFEHRFIKIFQTMGLFPRI